METLGMERTVAVCWRGLAELEPDVRAFARRRCRDVHELDDVVQETLLRAARYRRRLQVEDRLRAWTLRIAANVLRDRRIGERWISFLDSDGGLLEELEGGEVDPGSAGEWMSLTDFGLVMERDALVEQVVRVIGDLPAADARVLRSYYQEPLSTERAAAECGVAVSLVKTRLYRARKRLRHRLSRVLEVPAWAARGPTPARDLATQRPPPQALHRRSK